MRSARDWGAVPPSYSFGLGPALVAGRAIGPRQVLVGRVTGAMALGVGLAVGLGMAFLWGAAGFAPGRRDHSLIMIATCLIPTVACGALVRGWPAAGAREPAS